MGLFGRKNIGDAGTYAQAFSESSKRTKTQENKEQRRRETMIADLSRYENTLAKRLLAQSERLLELETKIIALENAIERNKNSKGQVEAHRAHIEQLEEQKKEIADKVRIVSAGEELTLRDLRKAARKLRKKVIAQDKFTKREAKLIGQQFRKMYISAGHL